MWKPLGAAVVLAAALVPVAPLGRAAVRVDLVNREGQARVDVTIDGKPFTSYRYPATLQKPVLYPIVAASGVVVTRGYPLEPRPGEAADHPHHVGHWFNYGDVNGYDFWGHSDATPAASKPKAGVIVHTGIAVVESGSGSGRLEALADWKIPDGTVLLRERTRFEFSGDTGRRSIDRTTTWTAAGGAVTFKDTKEGAFGIRVARALDHRSVQPGVVVGPDGNPGKKPRVDTSEATGEYLASDGRRGESVWGTRGPWMALTGTIERQQVTLAILDHPTNHGYPTSWHARGYGLFAANPFGRQGFDPAQPPAVFTLQPGASMVFRHRILVADGVLTLDTLAREHGIFTGAGTGR